MKKAHSRLTKYQHRLLATQPFILVRYIKQLQTLALALPFYLVIYWHLKFVPPEQIAHILIPNSYLPLQIYFFLGNFFLFSFLFLNVRRGFLCAVASGLMLFFQLQALLSWQIVFCIGVPLLGLELGLSLLDRQ